MQQETHAPSTMARNNPITLIDVLGREPVLHPGFTPPLPRDPNIPTMGRAGPQADGWSQAVNDYNACTRKCKPVDPECVMDGGDQAGTFGFIGGFCRPKAGTWGKIGKLASGAEAGIWGFVSGSALQAVWDETKYQICIAGCKLYNADSLPPGYLDD